MERKSNTILVTNNKSNTTDEDVNDFISRLADIFISIAQNNDGEKDEDKTQIEHTS